MIPILINLIPFVLLLGSLALLCIVVFYLVLRFKKLDLAHRERMTALEQGAPLPNGGAAPVVSGHRVYLLRGMIWLFTGLALTAFLFGLVSAI